MVQCGGSDADYLIELDTERAVRAVRPNFALLREIPTGVIVTAAASCGSYDFVSRYFAASWGIDEDPVTGSAHCALAPYWASRMGTELVGKQVSERGGVVRTRFHGDRVTVTGGAVTVSQGILVV